MERNMKMELDANTGRLRLMAECHDDLVMLEKIITKLDLHWSEQLLKPVEEVPFADASRTDLGQYVAEMEGHPMRVMVGLGVPWDRLTLCKPTTEAEKLRASAASRLGYAFLNALEVMRAEAKAG
jgi:hypothetical protein